MSANELPPERPNSDSIDEATDRLAEIVRAAERAATSVIDDAEAQAQTRIDEAQKRADRIVADRLRAIADELDPPAADASERPRLRPVEPVADEPAPEGLLSRRASEAGARLLATQMAVSGASRKEIEDRLRSGAGIEDPAPMLDAILGPAE